MQETLERLDELEGYQSPELGILQRKELVSEAKRRYGRDWYEGFSKEDGGGVDWAKLRFDLAER